MQIFVLGSGATGGLLARLLRRQGHQVVCGDREPERAKTFLPRRMECVHVNAHNLRSLVLAGRGCDLIVNAAPAVFNESVLRAALELRAHYLDMASHLARSPFLAEQLRFHAAFVRIGRTALINAGAAPGMTNLLVARYADLLGPLEQVHIRLFEQTGCRLPIAMWSGEVAYDEAVSPPPVYRNGRFRLAPRFSGDEWFRFPEPIGEKRVFLAAQDEVATLPRFLALGEINVKIGGDEMERLRRWYRQGKLRACDKRVKRRFPQTIPPAEVAQMLAAGKFGDVRFAACVSVIGRLGRRKVVYRHSCLFPTLRELWHTQSFAMPVAFAAAQSAAAFVNCFPRDLPGVLPPEALPLGIRGSVLKEMRRRRFRFRESDPCQPGEEQ